MNASRPGLRIHVQTAGVMLMAQQSENNVVRVAYQALAAVLGGTQSLRTDSLDVTLALLTEKSARIALRTQQILAYETGVPNTIDPLAGSYYVESLTDELEAQAEAILADVDQLGGVVPGIERGYLQREIARSVKRQQHGIEEGERLIVGAEGFTGGDDDASHEILRVGETAMPMTPIFCYETSPKSVQVSVVPPRR